MRYFKTLYTILCLGLLCACNNKVNLSPTKEEQLNRLDSLVLLKQKQIQAQQTELLKDRMSIEVRAIADSIMEQYYQQRKLSKPIMDSAQLKSIIKDSIQESKL